MRRLLAKDVLWPARRQRSSSPRSAPASISPLSSAMRMTTRRSMSVCAMASSPSPAAAPPLSMSSYTSRRAAPMSSTTCLSTVPRRARSLSAPSRPDSADSFARSDRSSRRPGMSPSGTANTSPSSGVPARAWYSLVSSKFVSTAQSARRFQARSTACAGHRVPLPGAARRGASRQSDGLLTMTTILAAPPVRSSHQQAPLPRSPAPPVNSASQPSALSIGRTNIVHVSRSVMPPRLSGERLRYLRISPSSASPSGAAPACRGLPPRSAAP